MTGSPPSMAPGFLAVSVGEGATTPDVGSATEVLHTLGEVVVELGRPTPGAVVSLSKGLRTPTGRFEVPARGVAPGIVPPGAVAWATQDRWYAASDAAGLHHLYWRQGTGWAAVSTSAVALGRLSDPRPDRNALGVAALVGHALGPFTVVSEVRRLQGGEVCELRAGVAAVTRVAPPGIAPKSWTADEDALRRTGADAVRQIVGEALEQAVEPVLELSGGLDSRVLLAAIPPELRRGLPALTIGAPDSSDVLVASEIARRSGLDHRCIDTRGVADLSPGEAEELVISAGRRVDWSGNPVTLGMLSWVESRIADDRPRISGQNGEFGRGFYYALLPRWLPNARATVTALGRWRVIANDQVDPELLRRDDRSQAERAALQALRALVPPGPFLAATDELYLEMRMGRWVGPAYTLSSRSRTVLAPFFDRRYLTWVRSTSPSRRRGSRALAGVLRRLDGDLASIPLADGPPPNILSGGGLRATRATAPAFGRKVAAKVRQRIRTESRTPVGAGALAALVQRAWAERADALEAAASSPLVRPEVVAAIAQGSRSASAATIGFLVALDHLERKDFGS